MEAFIPLYQTVSELALNPLTRGVSETALGFFFDKAWKPQTWLDQPEPQSWEGYLNQMIWQYLSDPKVRYRGVGSGKDEDAWKKNVEAELNQAYFNRKDKHAAIRRQAEAWKMFADPQEFRKTTSRWVERMNQTAKRFEEHLGINLLLGFNLLEDMTVRMDADHWLALAHAATGLTEPSQIKEWLKNPPDTPGPLERVFLHLYKGAGGSDKPKMDEDMKQVLYPWFESQEAQHSAGGSTAIQAKAFASVPNLRQEAAFYFMPPKPKASKLYKHDLVGVNAVEFRRERGQWHKCPPDGREELAEDPRRINCIFDLPPRRVLVDDHTAMQKLSDGGLDPTCVQDALKQNADRVIYSTQYYSHPNCDWEILEVVAGGQARRYRKTQEFPDHNTWFGLPLIAERKYLPGERTLRYTLPDLADLAGLMAGHDCYLFDGIKPALDPKLVAPEHLEPLNGAEPLGNLLFEQIGCQVSALSGRGMKVHFEMSGEPSGEFLAGLKKLVSSGLTSLGLNHDDLGKFFKTQANGTPLVACTEPALAENCGEHFERYQQAASLMSCLGEPDWLYVHANDLDLALVRLDGLNEAEARQRMAHYVDTLLFSKAGLVIKILERSGMKRDQILREAHAALSIKGRLAQLEFAYDFSRHYAEGRFLRYGTERSHSQSQTFLNLVNDGYAVNAHGWGVAALPVIWPDIADRASLTGAGDITSGLAAVYAAFEKGKLHGKTTG